MSRFRRVIAVWVALAVSYSAGLQAAQAEQVSSEGLIGTAELAALPNEGLDASARRTQLADLLERDDVAAELMRRGVDRSQARQRIAALTDAEVLDLGKQIDLAPAGGDFFGVAATVFVILLITDILGFTKIFPFTRSIRR